jgi:hypothetical protein
MRLIELMRLLGFVELFVGINSSNSNNLSNPNNPISPEVKFV